MKTCDLDEGSVSVVFSATRLALSVAIAFGLTACVNASEISQGHGIAVSQTWASLEGVDDREMVDLEMWLSDFQSSGLESLVVEALANNRDLQVTAARVKEARAIARIQTAPLLPALGAGGTAARSRVNVSDGAGGKNKSLGNAFGADLTLSWEIDLWSKLNNERRAAVLDYEAQRSNFRYAQLSLAGGVVRSWFALVEAENQYSLARETEESFTRALRMVRGRYEQGLRRGLDVRLASSNAASARALSAARAEQVRRASTALEVLLGRYPAGSLSGDGELPTLTPRTTDALPTELLARRPDLAAAQAQAVAAELRHSAALKDLLPTIGISSSGGYQDSELKDLENPSNLIWTLAGNIIQPLFQGGALRARAMAADARGDEAMARYAMSLLTAFQEVETTLFAEKTLAVQVTSLGEAAHEAVEAEKLASDLYSRGLTGIFELLEAQRRSLNARSSYLDVKRQQLSNRVTLYLALGGGIPTVEDPASRQHVPVGLRQAVSHVE